MRGGDEPPITLTVPPAPTSPTFLTLNRGWIFLKVGRGWIRSPSVSDNPWLTCAIHNWCGSATHCTVPPLWTQRLWCTELLPGKVLTIIRNSHLPHIQSHLLRISRHRARTIQVGGDPPFLLFCFLPFFSFFFSGAPTNQLPPLASIRWDEIRPHVACGLTVAKDLSARLSQTFVGGHWFFVCTGALWIQHETDSPRDWYTVVPLKWTSPLPIQPVEQDAMPQSGLSVYLPLGYQTDLSLRGAQTHTGL